MSTKLNPGKFDCYAAAEPDEPMFIFLARDERAPKLIRRWVRKRGKDDAKAKEALACANEMEEWRKLHPDV
jgi:hypothetical protein